MTLFLCEPESLVQSSSNHLYLNSLPNFGKLDSPLHDPHKHSQGKRQIILLCSGIYLVIDQYTLQENLVVETAPGKPGFDLEFSFMILGDNHTEQTLAGENFLCLGFEPGISGLVDWQAGQRILKFDIHITVEAFVNAIAHCLELVDPKLRQFLKHSDHIDCFQMGVNTPAICTIIYQILNCPYEGLTRQLYLEGKVLELMALRLDQYIQNEPQPRQKSSSKSQERDRLHYAKEILIHNLEHPPSLLELSQQVGLNTRKLKEGFRREFDTTVFGYLHSHRMEQARKFMKEGQMTVAEVAYAVGYANRSHFAAAFRKRFGMNPSELFKETQKQEI